MSENIRGWRRVQGEMREQTAAQWPESIRHNVGFRLVHDGASRIYRTSSWFSAAAGVGVMDRYSSASGSRRYYLGFRLTFDREEG